jgi:protein arginine kinase
MELKGLTSAGWLARREHLPGCLAVRIQVFRNLAGIPFFSKMSDQHRQEVLAVMTGKIAKEPEFKDWRIAEWSRLSDPEREYLIEEGLVSHEFNDYPGLAIAVCPEKPLCIIINGPNHFAIQSWAETLPAARAEAERIDDGLLKGINPAFDRRIGFLTSTHDYAGNGLKLTALLHLPAARRMNDLGRTRDLLLREMLDLVSIGTDPVRPADIYILKNAGEKYFGQTEEEAFKDFQERIDALIRIETGARSSASEKEQAQFGDEAWRSFGILRYAGSLDQLETFHFLSLCLWGVEMGLFKLKKEILKELFVWSQSGHLSALYDPEVVREKGNAIRATLIRERLFNERQ